MSGSILGKIQKMMSKGDFCIVLLGGRSEKVIKYTICYDRDLLSGS